jgi:hypothetical protein
MAEYEYQEMLKRVNGALEVMREVLEKERLPAVASDVPHSYEDKYLLAESMVNVCIASLLNNLALIGLTRDVLGEVKRRYDSEGVAVSLCWESSQKCTFLREHTYDQDSAVKYQVSSPLFGDITSKTVTTVHEFYWDFNFTHQLFLYFGSNPLDKISLAHRNSNKELKTPSNVPPHQHQVSRPLTLNLNWMLKFLNSDLRINFRIN